MDLNVDRDDPDCAKSEVKDYADNNDGNILICWEHKALDDVASALGVSIGKYDHKFASTASRPNPHINPCPVHLVPSLPDYPKDHFDLIYVVQHKELVDNSPYSENCPGLDS